jgi:hypothetical protein
MTIRVTVTNAEGDGGATRPLAVQVFSRSTDIEKYPDPKEPYEVAFIGPGHSATFTIHKYQYLVVKE